MQNSSQSGDSNADSFGMYAASFSRQLVALLKRNFLLKKRTPAITVQEFFYPIYLVAILGAVRLSVQGGVKPAVERFDERSLSNWTTLPPCYLLVSPNTSTVDQLIQDLNNSLKVVQSYKLFYDWMDAERFHGDNGTQTDLAVIGIHFTDGTLTQGEYRLRFSSNSVPGTTDSLNYGDQGGCRQPDGLGGCNANNYLHSGFVQLQMALDYLLIKKLTGVATFPPPTLQIQQMPKSEWITSTVFVQTFSAIYFVLAYSMFVTFLLILVVNEKEKGLKSGMQLMGLKTTVLWLSWVIVYAVIILVVSVVITVLSYAIKLFVHSNLGLIFLLLMLYGFSIISFSFMLTPFFKKAETAGGVGSLSTTLFSLLYLAVSLTRTDYSGPNGPQSSIPAPGQWALCLLSPVALALGIDQSLYLDLYTKEGLELSTMWFGQFPVAGSFIMLAVDTVLYGMLALYFDNVVPDPFGQKRSPLFFLKPSFWCPRAHTDEEVAELTKTLSSDLSDPSIVEPVRSDLADKNVIRIFNIRKKFRKKKNKTFNAVDGLSLDIYEGQITAILGHNGAGKTTLMNMLTGLTPPSSGTAFIYNLDVADPVGQDEIHRMMGVCPQENILIPNLTCLEHMQLFADIKNIPSDEVEQQIKQTLEDVDLTSQKDVQTEKLSGGQKRKLSLGMALLGNPKILLLDEPTAGLDPYSRRYVWNLLKDRCKKRVVLLTTHFMDEADILADRKAFMSKGQLKCAGSSLFLKNRFGLGYHISMVSDAGCDPEPITKMIQMHIPEASLNRVHGQEISYVLPLKSMESFPVLMRAVEEAIDEQTLGIRTYGVSMTSLEEVFLKIGIEEVVDDDAGDVDHDNHYEPREVYRSLNMSERPDTGNQTSNHTADEQQVTLADPEDDLNIEKGNLALEQFKGLCKVRYIHIIRNKSSFFFRIIMPVVFIIAGVAIYQTVDPDAAEPKPLRLDLSMYTNTSLISNNPNTVYQVSTPPGVVDWQDFVMEINDQGYPTTRILNQTSLLNSEPHHAGFTVYDMNTTTPNIISNLTALYNDTATHSLPMVLNLISNALIGLTGTPGVNITAYSFPWPDAENLPTNWANFGSAIMIGLALAPTPAALAVLLVRDREAKIRSQLRLTGVTHSMYWITVLFTDLSQLITLVLLTIIVILAFQVPPLVTAGAMLSLFLVYMLYLPLLLLIAYIISFAFSKFQTAQGAMYNIFSITGIVGYMAVSMLDAFGQYNVASILHYVFCVVLIPYVPIGALYLINRVYIRYVIAYGLDVAIPVSAYFKWDTLIPYTLIMAVVHYMWAPLVLRCLEIRSTGGHVVETIPCLASKSKRTQVKDIPDSHRIRSHTEDSDVEEERQSVEQLPSNEDKIAERPVVKVHDLRKVFAGPSGKAGCCGGKKAKSGGVNGPKIAVVRSTFMVKPGEILGLLGPNGAGKTTTLNLITAEQTPTRGNVAIAGYDISSNMSDAFQHLGFCPQHDALWDDITLREHLDLYLALRGIRGSFRKPLINYYLQALRVRDHADKVAKKLSGGTKRKLSYAMSTIGKPDLVLLDEPSTGLDPKSKRFLWDTISSTIAGSERGAILTTHYMEEADALCTRVGIMVNGQMMCLGSTQHLKNKYGSGYILEVKLHSVANNDILHEFVTELFPDAVRSENFLERATYKISQDSIKSLAHVFETLENNKERLTIEDYSFSQSTLEQVFLSFAKNQLDDRNDEDDTDSSRQHLAEA